MKIQVGIYKNRKINTLKTNLTRPTTSRVKENIFNILGQFFDSETFLDLFAGFGFLGFEAASRGASKVYMNDYSKKCFLTMKKTMEEFKCEEKVELFNKDWKTFLRTTDIKNIDYIFLDPPYKKNIDNNLIISCLIKSNIFNINSTIILKSDKKFELDEKNDLFLELRKDKKYGYNYVYFFKIKERNKNE